MDGISIMGVLIAILEDMHGKIDSGLPNILEILMDELKHATSKKNPSKNYTSMILQAFAMAFAYNSMIVF